MKLYKLTDSNGFTKNETRWALGITVSIPGDAEPRLCSGTVLHAYTSPLLAAMMKPAHADYRRPRCFVVEGDVVVTDGTKVGCRSLTVMGEFDLPTVSTTQHTAFGVLCALQGTVTPEFREWAERWLDGTDRTAYAAAAANAAAAYAANAAYAAYATNAAIDFQVLAEQAMLVAE